MSEQKVVEPEQAPVAAALPEQASEPYVAILIPRRLIAEWAANIATFIFGVMLSYFVLSLVAEE